jgi:hypothetical protein
VFSTKVSEGNFTSKRDGKLPVKKWEYGKVT